MGETASPRLGPRHRADTSVRALRQARPRFRRGRAHRPGRRESAPGRPWESPLFARPATRRAAAAVAVVAFLGPLAATLCAPAVRPVVDEAAAAPPATVLSPDRDDLVERAALVRADRAHRPTSLYPDGIPAPAATTAAPKPAAATSPPAPRATTAAPRPARTRGTSSSTRSRTETATTTAQAPAATGDVAAVLAYARAQVGKPYVYGAAGPNAFDCSGLVMAAYARIGIRLPHKASALFGVGHAVSRGDIRPGDVLVLEGGGHTAIALGGGLMIHASRAGQPVAIVKIYANPNAVRRLVG